MLVILAAVTLTLAAQDELVATNQPPPLACEAGPVRRTFGQTPWLAYGCDDGKTVVISAERGSRAAPFNFIVTFKGEVISAYGEGAGGGRPDGRRAVDAAFGELKTMTRDQHAALLAEALKPR